MNKMRKKLSMVVLGVVLVMALSVTAFASSAWDSFSTKLPANQGDTEVSTVARASDSVDHFNIQINSLSNGYTAVRAWAETTPILIGNSALEVTGMFITIPIIFRLKEPTSH